MSTDEQLIEQLRRGKADALDQLYERYSRKLYALCHSITRSENAEDLVQDVFVRVIEAADTFDPERASFRTWVFRIARNRCIDVIRREGRIRFVSIEAETKQDDGQETHSVGTIVDESMDVEGSVINASVMENVRECIGELANYEEKHALILYYMVGKVYREIGEILGKSISLVKNRVKSAQEKVKRCLERKGVDSFH